MLPDNAQLIENAVLVSLPTDRLASEKEILEAASRFRAAFPLTDEDFTALIKRLHARLSITMDMGVVLVEDDQPPWLNARKPSIDPFYWDRYSKLLMKDGWPPAVIRTLDRVTDEILDHTGDPTRGGSWMRRGLVVGDVQSGKTATYTGLCCKAADAGYRLIVLLTGTLENLRRQTQERLDEGFVGLDSSGVLSRQKRERASRLIGVGVLDQRRAAGVFTSHLRDFNRDILNSLGFRLDAFNEPVLVVIKKHRGILENLENWLRDRNANDQGKIDVPMLLIDDEADSASVNTNSENSGPTRINERIRALLRLFSRSSYVGFTATPFANIFIDPETEDEMLGHDLFPRNFIYCLEPPSNYVGPLAVFGGEARSPILRTIEDAEAVFPPKHKSSHSVHDLPGSLREAVRSFILASTIRDLRHERLKHRSMLVNVSRFTAVQDQVAGIIDRELREMQQDIRNYSQLSPSEALLNSNLRALRDTWGREYDGAGFDWPTVQKALLNGALPIVVRPVNQRTGASSLDYRAHRDNGLRVIAVGGNSLSRGLTLEGLSTSYFFRNSQMYDTLLQMGRWFGYRDGFADLIRLWLTDEASQWYAHITEATEELRDEMKRMRSLQLTPREFGLKVRAHPDTLIVTARNKMRLARTIERVVSVSGQGMETPRLRSNPDAIRANAAAVAAFVESMRQAGLRHEPSALKNTLWRNVPKQHVATLLKSFDSHPQNIVFQATDLGLFVEQATEPKLDLWDVVIPNGKETAQEMFGLKDVKPARRAIDLNSQTGAILVSGSKLRVASRGTESEGIPLPTVRDLEERYLRETGKNIPDKEFRKIRPRPLLLVHVINAYMGEKRLETGGVPLVALGLSFPEFDDSGIARRVTYRINLVEWRSMFEEEVDDDQPSEDELAN